MNIKHEHGNRMYAILKIELCLLYCNRSFILNNHGSSTRNEPSFQITIRICWTGISVLSHRRSCCQWWQWIQFHCLIILIHAVYSYSLRRVPPAQSQVSFHLLNGTWDSWEWCSMKMSTLRFHCVQSNYVHRPHVPLSIPSMRYYSIICRFSLRSNSGGSWNQSHIV